MKTHSTTSQDNWTRLEAVKTVSNPLPKPTVGMIGSGSYILI